MQRSRPFYEMHVCKFVCKTDDSWLLHVSGGSGNFQMKKEIYKSQILQLQFLNVAAKIHADITCLAFHILHYLIQSYWGNFLKYKNKMLNKYGSFTHPQCIYIISCWKKIVSTWYAILWAMKHGTIQCRSAVTLCDLSCNVVAKYVVGEIPKCINSTISN